MTSAGRTGAQRAAVERKNARRILRKQPDQVRQSSFCPDDRAVRAPNRCRFKPDDAERTALELLHLFVAGMRRMIGGDRVDGAVHKPFVTASTSPRSRSGGFIL